MSKKERGRVVATGVHRDGIDLYQAVEAILARLEQLDRNAAEDRLGCNDDSVPNDTTPTNTAPGRAVESDSLAADGETAA